MLGLLIESPAGAERAWLRAAWTGVGAKGRWHVPGRVGQVFVE
jgi:hypothetical protein